MPHPIRSLVIAGWLLAAVALAGCGSSGGSDAAPVSTTRATTTTAPTTTTEASTTTGGPSGTTTTAATPGDGVDCQALLQEYADRFDPDDLADTVTFFREYEPSMPDDVAAATERLAVAYEEAGDLGHMDLSDVDLTADAQTFSDWTNDGCPAG